MRSESIALVLCRFGTPKMLSQTKRYGRLGEYGRCMHEMASLWKVSIYLLIYFLSSTCVEYNIFRFCCRAQPVRVVTVTVLGQFWHGWIGKL